jgi:hypothetical protein
VIAAREQIRHRHRRSELANAIEPNARRGDHLVERLHQLVFRDDRQLRERCGFATTMHPPVERRTGERKAAKVREPTRLVRE